MRLSSSLPILLLVKPQHKDLYLHFWIVSMTCFGCSLQILEEASSGGVLCLHLFGAIKMEQKSRFFKNCLTSQQFLQVRKDSFLNFVVGCCRIVFFEECLQLIISLSDFFYTSWTCDLFPFYYFRMQFKISFIYSVPWMSGALIIYKFTVLHQEKSINSPYYPKNSAIIYVFNT